MSEIKFRARITDENGNPTMFYQEDQYLISFLRRVTSHLYFHKDTKEEVNEMNGGRHESYLKPYELENCLDRYVGLKDKNGKEIYEGDIVKIENRGKYKVDYLEHSMKFFFQTLEEDDEQFTATPEKIEIIGNIYENKELLK